MVTFEFLAKSSRLFSVCVSILVLYLHPISLQLLTLYHMFIQPREQLLSRFKFLLLFILTFFPRLAADTLDTTVMAVAVVAVALVSLLLHLSLIPVAFEQTSAKTATQSTSGALSTEGAAEGSMPAQTGLLPATHLLPNTVESSNY